MGINDDCGKLSVRCDILDCRALNAPPWEGTCAIVVARYSMSLPITICLVIFVSPPSCAALCRLEILPSSTHDIFHLCQHGPVLPHQLLR